MEGHLCRWEILRLVVHPNIEEFTYTWIIVKWEDTNNDGFVNPPGKGDNYTLIASGW